MPNHMATMNNTKAVMPSLVVLPQSEWEGVKNLLAEVKNALQAKSKAEIDAQWLESSEARKMLGVSAKTWQDYRDKRLITFSQFGRKIYVRRAEIESFLESHCIKSVYEKGGNHVR